MNGIRKILRLTLLHFRLGQARASVDRATTKPQIRAAVEHMTAIHKQIKLLEQERK